MEKWLTSGQKEEKPDEPCNSFSCQDAIKCSKNDEHMSKVQRNQLERTLTCEI